MLRSDEWESGLEGDEWDNELMPRGDEQESGLGSDEWVNGLVSVSLLRGGMYQCQKGIYVKRRKEHVSREELKG